MSVKERAIKRVVGLSPSGIAVALSQLTGGRSFGSLAVSGSSGQTLVVCANGAAVEQLADDLEFFLPKGEAAPHVSRFLPWDVLPFDGISPSIELIAERLHSLHCLLSRKSSIVVTTLDALAQKILPPTSIVKSMLELNVGAACDRDRLVQVLDILGYTKASLVEELGQMAVRGAVVDLFPAGQRYPIRLELYGDRLDSIRYFDPANQRSLTERTSPTHFVVLPISEVLPGVDRLQDYLEGSVELKHQEWVRSATDRLRKRALELEIHPRIVDTIEDVLLNGGRWPGLEHLSPVLHDQSVTLLDYVDPETTVVLCDELGVVAASESFSELVIERELRAKEEGTLFPAPGSAYSDLELALSQVRDRADVAFDLLGLLRIDDLGADDADQEVSVVREQGIKLPVATQDRLAQALKVSRHHELPLKPLADEIARNSARGIRVGLLASHRSKAKRFRELLATYGIHCEEVDTTWSEWQENRGSAAVSILHGYCSGGLIVPDLGVSLITDHEVFPDQSGKKPRREVTSVRKFLGSLSQIKEDDVVVHIDHGVARYRGLRQLKIEGQIADFLLLEYAEGAKLFVPVENIGKVQKYVGAEGANPALSKLGGKSWSLTKEKVKKNVAELAGQLLQLYAERELIEAPSFSPFGSDDEEFAETFPFQETPDQEKAINDVIGDMSRSRPMDRLVCGDVGFGKTEVALRAAFKSVSQAKQVAFLVPTTILADQHYTTFKERFRDFPYRVACVSRFYPSAENKQTLEKVARGEIDIIIGTHRLLQKDVYFRDLGLVIVDEEHRFGVADKERLKRVRREVHVLTMTATPIPRTLYMSLFDIRDLSVIETPPTDRQVIRTYLSTYSAGVIREAVMRELGRSGQVFYIHNRVANIAMIADEVRELIPEARVGFAHGQMRDDELESVMHKFITHELDVLVSTTIVESGLDIPNANTIVIRDADRLGLAELYQLRGRVGRSSRRAYAYLLIDDAKKLGVDAKKRLQVLQSLDDLGQGFRLALQDMEIRGAGNLLGKDQSGKIELVGFDLYSRILKEAIREVRARESKDPTSLAQALEAAIDPEINIGFPAHIPAYYIPDVEERLLLYQRLVGIRAENEAQDMLDEITDRFGHLPQEVVTLLEIMVFRGLLRRAGIVAASYRSELLSLTFHREAPVDADRLMRKVHGSLGKLKLTPNGVLSIKVAETAVESPAALTAITKRLLVDIGYAFE